MKINLRRFLQGIISIPIIHSKLAREFWQDSLSGCEGRAFQSTHPSYLERSMVRFRFVEVLLCGMRKRERTRMTGPAVAVFEMRMKDHGDVVEHRPPDPARRAMEGVEMKANSRHVQFCQSSRQAIEIRFGLQNEIGPAGTLLDELPHIYIKRSGPLYACQRNTLALERTREAPQFFAQIFFPAQRENNHRSKIMILRLRCEDEPARRRPFLSR